MHKQNDLEIDDNSEEIVDNKEVDQILNTLLEQAKTFVLNSEKTAKEFMENNSEANPNLLSKNADDAETWFHLDNLKFRLPILKSSILRTEDYLSGFPVLVDDDRPGPEYLVEQVIDFFTANGNVVDSKKSKAGIFLDRLLLVREYLRSDPKINHIHIRE